jgi:hypothetical protein
VRFLIASASFRSQAVGQLAQAVMVIALNASRNDCAPGA